MFPRYPTSKHLALVLLAALAPALEPPAAAQKSAAGDPGEDSSRGAAGITTAIVLDEAVRPAQAGAAGEIHLPLRQALDVWSYLPIPLPLSVETKTASSVENQPISFNLITGEERLLDWAAPGKREPPLRRTEGNTGAIDVLRQDPPGNVATLEKNFSNLLLMNAEEYPWRVAAKLFIEFEDVYGVTYYSSCSGSLIDSMHVITAGHCVFAHDLNGVPATGWAKRIVAVPGYENGQWPYGGASAFYMFTWTGWAVDENHDHDMALIALDRPVGALTGWFGYAWTDSCSFLKDGSFSHAGYPADWPFDGHTMYANAGDYDACEEVLGYWYGNEIRFNNQSWGGQSGSGSFAPYFACPPCWVWAVLSNGTTSYTNDVRITADKFDTLLAVIVDNTPVTFDLVPLGVAVAPSPANAGEALSSMLYLVHNSSFAAWSGDVLVEVYLSDDPEISTSDTLIQVHAFSWDFGAKSSVWINVVPPPTIPATTLSGQSFVGVRLLVMDAVASNNESDGDDAAPVDVLSDAIFSDGFESGNTSAWSATQG